MKKILLTLTACLFLSSSWVMGQTAVLSFNDNSGTPDAGTYNQNAVFSVDVSLALTSGGIFTNWTGFSLWLETETGVASTISITAETLFTFTTATNIQAKPWNFTDVSGRTSVSFLTDQSASQSGDLGGTAAPTASGSYQVATIQFTLTNAPVGTWTLGTTTVSPKVSIGTATDDGTNFTDVNLAHQIYTFTVVPEPATWSLMALGGLGALGLNLLRARRKS